MSNLSQFFSSSSAGNPIGAIVPMVTGMQPSGYALSGSVIDIATYPAIVAFLTANNKAYSAIETTLFPLSGQVPLVAMACSSSEIVAIGQNSMIYRSTDNGNTWTTYNTPAIGGVFSSPTIDYAAGAGGFYIYDNRNMYLSVNGTTWTSYASVVPANFFSGAPWVIYTRVFWSPSISAWVYANFTGMPQLGWATDYYLYKKNDITATAVVYASIHSDTGAFGICDFVCQGFVYWLTSTTLPAVIPCVNGLSQNKIFFTTGYITSSGQTSVTAYANSFVFPSTTVICYDPANSRYMAINKALNQYYKSSDGITWSSPLSIGAGTYTLNSLGIQTNASTFVAVGSATKTTADNGATWNTRAFLSLGGTFTKVATSPTGVTVAIANTSSVVARATNGTGFVLVDIGETGSWVNIHHDGTKFILTSTTKQLKTSTDGLVWTTASTHTAFPDNASAYITSMCNIGSSYCAVSQDSNSTLTSTDGTTWIARSAVLGSTGYASIAAAVIGATTRMIAAGGSNIAYSDAIGTSAFASAYTTAAGAYSLIYANNMVACISTTSNKAYYSNDGITWNSVTTPIQPVTLSYANGVFVIKGSSYLVTTADFANFGIPQPCEAITSIPPAYPARTIYDPINNKLITASASGISYGSLSGNKIRLPYIASTDTGKSNYVKVA